MRRILVVPFFVVLLVCFFTLANANAQTAGQEKTGLDKQQAENLKKQLDGLKEVFGIEAEKPRTQTSQPQQQPAQKKTVADVADKGLDMVKQWVADAAITLNKVAPDVWRVMMKQQYAKAIADLIGPWGTFLLLLMYIAVMRKKWVLTQDKDINIDKETKIKLSTIRAWIVYVIPIAFLFLAALFGLSYLSDSIKLLINPEFYALRDLILILLGKS